MKTIRVGSRESRLAVVQTRLVADYIQEALPEAEVRLVTMKTTGDRILDRPLEAVGGLDEALKASDVELAALFEPPSETNFGGGLLTGTQSACNAACAAFAEAVKAVAARPREI